MFTGCDDDLVNLKLKNYDADGQVRRWKYGNLDEYTKIQKLFTPLVVQVKNSQLSIFRGVDEAVANMRKAINSMFISEYWQGNF